MSRSYLIRVPVNSFCLENIRVFRYYLASCLMSAEVYPVKTFSGFGKHSRPFYMYRRWYIRYTEAAALRLGSSRINRGFNSPTSSRY